MMLIIIIITIIIIIIIITYAACNQINVLKDYFCYYIMFMW